MNNYTEYRNAIKIDTSYNLMLDDIRDPQTAYYVKDDARFLNKQWVLVVDYDEFVDCIVKNGVPALVAFDHDLISEHYDYCNTFHEWMNYHADGRRVKTGYDCARFLYDKCRREDIKLPDYIIHTQNHIGRKAIKFYLETGQDFDSL